MSWIGIPAKVTLLFFGEWPVTGKQFERKMARWSHFTPAHLQVVMTSLREAGMIPAGGRGPHAPELGFENVAYALLGASTAGTASEASHAAATYYRLHAFGPPFEGHPSLGSALTAILTDGDRARRVLSLEIITSWPKAIIRMRGSTTDCVYGYDAVEAARDAGFRTTPVYASVTFKGGVLHQLHIDMTTPPLDPEMEALMHRRTILAASALVPMTWFVGCAADASVKLAQAKSYAQVLTNALAAAGQAFLASSTVTPDQSKLVIEILKSIDTANAALQAAVAATDARGVAEQIVAAATRLTPLVEPFAGAAGPYIPLAVSVLAAFVASLPPPPAAPAEPPPALRALALKRR
jgi:sulfur relay (sulfurtransferase) complex TusBCD TusD component (DsrE family)